MFCVDRGGYDSIKDRSIWNIVVFREEGRSLNTDTLVTDKLTLVGKCFGILDVFLNYVIVNVHNSTTMLK